MPSLFLQSPAKVNLYLKVLNKRKDGYHNIVTLFERIDLVDDITLTINTPGRITIECSHPHVPLNSKNLVYKVAEILQKDFKIEKGVHIKIHKRIPVAAGLGGGSSNAATVLMGLNKLWALGLSREQMLVYARNIGSDVSFFMYNKSWALGTEKGDKIKPLDIPVRLWHLLVVPRLKIYSGKVYEGLKMKLTKRSDNVNILIHHLRKNNLFEVSHLIQNDLESVILRFAPQLGQLKRRLQSSSAQGVMISGSGPAIFGIIGTEDVARKLKDHFQKRFAQVFVVQTL